MTIHIILRLPEGIRVVEHKRPDIAELLEDAAEEHETNPISISTSARRVVSEKFRVSFEHCMPTTARIEVGDKIITVAHGYLGYYSVG